MATLDFEPNAAESDNISDDDEEYFSAEESLSPSPCSRPAPRNYTMRACDPVDLMSVGRDYRARRHKTTTLEYLSDSEDSFVSCEEYVDEETPDEESFSSGNEEEDLYYSIIGPPGRPKGLIKSLEDRSLLFYGSAQEYYPTGE
ncbi:hypothetical protein N7524_009787 [Penicillium chrysogenum]|nr:hypothetical protein N7524_009787 [Penicillium chrysogenum]